MTTSPRNVEIPNIITQIAMSGFSGTSGFLYWKNLVAIETRLEPRWEDVVSKVVRFHIIYK